MYADFQDAFVGRQVIDRRRLTVDRVIGEKNAALQE
jgi:hypothetical protein